jgi:hypothetical protein
MTGVIISSSLTVVAGVDGLNTNSPIIGYQNLVTTTNIAATTEDADFPVVNLANPATHLRWKSGAGSPSSDEYITITLNTVEQVDYLGIAVHNFGTSSAPVSVEGTTEAPGGSPDPWFELITPRLLSDDGPVIFRFDPQFLHSIRLRIQPSQAATPVTPYLAIMYVGELLVLQRRIYVGHTPIKFGRHLNVANHRSISGNFLGRIVLGEKVSTTIALKNLTPSWYRSHMDPFLVEAKEIPFFFAWRPGTYSTEVGYVWLTDDPEPANQLSNGMMQVSLNVEGVV